MANISSSYEPIKVIEVIVDEVTEPRLDNTPGSALYAVPFRLNRAPSHVWSELFVRSWNSPPAFSTMHRPGIASVYGDKIILNGTTIEEVKKYHRDTLVLCVNEANNDEKKLLASQRQNEKNRREQMESNRRRVKDEAKDLSFD